MCEVSGALPATGVNCSEFHKLLPVELCIIPYDLYEAVCIQD
uniref:Uncharacterized protein n=1 Tax=Anguilla anguilla TaxID=7936 RepID=A0A0E9XVK3_ANGAN